MITVNETFKAIVLRSDETKFLSITYENDNKRSFIVQYKDFNSEEVIKITDDETLSSLHFKFSHDMNSGYLTELLKKGRIAEIKMKQEIEVKDEIEFTNTQFAVSNSDVRMYHVSNEFFEKPDYKVIGSKNILQGTHYFKDGALGFHCTNKPFDELANQAQYKNMSQIYIYAVSIKDEAKVKFVSSSYYEQLIGDGEHKHIQELRLKLLQNQCDVLMIYDLKGSLMDITNCVVINTEAVETNVAINPKNLNLTQSIYDCKEAHDGNQYTGASSNRFMG